MNNTSNIFELTRQDTFVLKGIAICAMLLHHLYGCPPEGVEPYTGVFAWLGVLGKVCVALFLFCSGYGLAANYTPTSIKDDLKFIVRRLLKFYLNYWVIFLIFVPITVFCFHRSLNAAYGENNVWVHLLLDLLGFQDELSYNPTWWFNKLIIILYILFPCLYRLSRSKPLLILLSCIVLMRISAHIPFNPSDVCTWQFPFVMGIVWQLNEDKGARIQEWMLAHKEASVGIFIGLLIITTIIRMYPIIPHWSGMRIDGFLTCAIALFLISTLRLCPHLMQGLEFIGKHSMNMYMIHTFFNAYWCKEFLHTGAWMREGLNFILLLCTCLIFSIIIELIKEKAGFAKMYEQIKRV